MVFSYYLSGNNFVLAATIIGIESFNKKHIPVSTDGLAHVTYQPCIYLLQASKMRSYCFKTNGVQNNEIASVGCLIF